LGQLTRAQQPVQDKLGRRRHGAPEEKGMEWARHPEMMKRMKARQANVSSQSTKP